MTTINLSERQQLRVRMVSLAHVMRAYRGHPATPYRAWMKLNVLARRYRALRED